MQNRDYGIVMASKNKFLFDKKPESLKSRMESQTFVDLVS